MRYKLLILLLLFILGCTAVMWNKHSNIEIQKEYEVAPNLDILSNDSIPILTDSIR